MDRTVNPVSSDPPGALPGASTKILDSTEVGSSTALEKLGDRKVNRSMRLESARIYGLWSVEDLHVSLARKKSGALPTWSTIYQNVKLSENKNVSGNSSVSRVPDLETGGRVGGTHLPDHFYQLLFMCFIKCV